MSHVLQIHTVVYLGPRSRIPSAPPTTPHINGNSTHTGAGVLVAEKKWLLRSESPVTDFAFSHERTQPDRDAQLARGWEDLTVYFLLKDGAVYNLFPVSAVSDGSNRSYCSFPFLLIS